MQVGELHRYERGDDADYVLYAWDGAPSFCVWMIPGTWRED